MLMLMQRCISCHCIRSKKRSRNRNRSRNIAMDTAALAHEANQ